MVFAKDLDKLKYAFEKRASRKEFFFFCYIKGNPKLYPGDETLSEIEQVCLSAFCKESPDKSALAHKLRQAQPIKGLHYTNNLIELAAFAIHDRSAESSYLDSFCAKASARDVYVINRLFYNLCTAYPSPHSDIDKLTIALSEDRHAESLNALLLQAANEASDLVDIFVMREAYIKSISQHPDKVQIEDTYYLSNNLRNVIDYIVNRSDKEFNFIFILVSLLVFAPTAYLVLKYWELAEPLIWILTLLALLMVLVIGLFFGRLPDRLQFLKNFRDWKAKRVLRKTGLDADQASAVINKYQDKNAELSKNSSK